MEAALKLYKFQPAPLKGSRVALTPDPNGANLPEDGAPWRKIGEIDVVRGQGARIGASSDEILDLIDADGIVVWPFRSIESS